MKKILFLILIGIIAWVLWWAMKVADADIIPFSPSASPTVTLVIYHDSVGIDDDKDGVIDRYVGDTRSPSWIIQEGTGITIGGTGDTVLFETAVYWYSNGDTSLIIDADGDTVLIIYDDDAGSVVWKVGTEDQTLKILTDTMEVIDVISLIPVSTIAGIEWDGLNIDGSALDPSAVDAEVHGVHIDLSGVSTTNNPEIQGLNIKVPRPTDHALHMNSSVLVELDATSFASGMNASVLDATIDVTGSTGGSVHIVEANVLGHEAGTASGAVVTSYGDFPLLHQHAGVFLTPVQAGASSECGEWDSSGTNYVAGLDGVTVFDADNDGIFIGDADDKFDAVEIIYSANATKNIVARFFYATSPSAWTEFFPTDGTDGGQVDGVITFDPAGLAGWADTDIGQDVGEHDECYWVKIIRTRNGTVGTPTISVAKTLAPTEYLWDGDGDITADTVSSYLSIINGRVVTGNNHFTFTIFDPDAIYTADHEVCIVSRTEAALTITRYDVTCDADPGTELEYSLKWADAFIGFGNAAVIDDTATVAGVTTVTAGIADATIPANKCIYLLIESDPDDAITQIAFDITWDYD